MCLSALSVSEEIHFIKTLEVFRGSQINIDSLLTGPSVLHPEVAKAGGSGPPSGGVLVKEEEVRLGHGSRDTAAVFVAPGIVDVLGFSQLSVPALLICLSCFFVASFVASHFRLLASGLLFYALSWPVPH